MTETPVSGGDRGSRKLHCGGILLVECDPEFAGRIVSTLGEPGHGRTEVTHVGTLADALTEIGERDYDVILLALDLPDSEGLNTAIIVLQQALDTPVIVIAASNEDATAWETTDYGVQNVLTRDRFVPDILLPVLNHAISQHAMQLSLERHIRELELTNGRFLSLVADNADAIIVVDQIGIVRFVNPSAERLLQFSAADLLGQMFGVPLEGIENTEIDILAGGRNGRTAEIRVMKTLWDGERAYIVTMRDITERKKTERALRIAKQSAEQASAMKTQFLANMSHELRTPLNSIIGFSEMMKNGVLGELQPSKYREYVADIHRGGRHLLSLINDLLDLSKAEADALSIFEEKFDLVEIAQSVVESMLPQAYDKRIDLSCRAASEMVWFLGDERMMRQVLLNLVSNAIKFTPKGGDVSIDVERTAKGEIRLAVRDTGIGIPAEQIPRAFVAFVQVDNAYSRDEAQGTGLGLALAKRFVELHEGTIRMESEENVGTVVSIVFPAARTVGAAGRGDEVVPLTRQARTAEGGKGPRN